MLNLLLLLVSVFLLGSGWVLDHRLPRGRSGHGLSLLGLGRHDWGAVHAWIGYGAGALVVAHLALHVGWLRRVAARSHSWPLWVGFGVAAAMLAMLFLSPVRS